MKNEHSGVAQELGGGYYPPRPFRRGHSAHADRRARKRGRMRARRARAVLLTGPGCGVASTQSTHNRHTKPTTHATKLPPGPIPSTEPPTQPQYGAVVRRAWRAAARWLRGGVRAGRWATPRGDRDRTAHHAKMKTNSRRRSEMTSSA